MDGKVKKQPPFFDDSKISAKTGEKMKWMAIRLVV